MGKQEFIVAYPSPAGGATRVARLLARSAGEISQKLSTAEIWDPPPGWVNDQHLARLSGSRLYDLDDPRDLQLLVGVPDLVFHRDDPPEGARIFRTRRT